MPRDDDTDYTILRLHMLEKYGQRLTQELIASEWFILLPFYQTFTVERATYRNLVQSIEPSKAAWTRNPYSDWIGALIRADIYGYIFPGNPKAALETAYPDATLTHRREGIYGELWAAALISTAFDAYTIEQDLRNSVNFTPQGSELRQALESIIKIYNNADTCVYSPQMD